jgi:flagellar biosynthesis anti-sigma factor FlgM
MRIDLTSAMPEVTRSGSAVAGKVAAGASAASSSDDVAKLDTGSESISLMKKQLDAVPDVREKVVDSLHQAIGSSTYKISPDGIADRMLTDGKR